MNIYQYSKNQCEFFVIALTREKADYFNDKYIQGTYTDESELKEGIVIQSMSGGPKPEAKE